MCITLHHSGADCKGGRARTQGAAFGIESLRHSGQFICSPSLPTLPDLRILRPRLGKHPPKFFFHHFCRLIPPLAHNHK